MIALTIASMAVESVTVLAVFRGGVLTGIGACLPMLFVAAMTPILAFVVTPALFTTEHSTVRDRRPSPP